MKKIIIILVVLIVAITGCYRDNEKDLYPVTGICDTAGVKYSTIVSPLIQSNGCISCHGGSAPSGNISLQSYTAVKAVAVSGKLYGAISHAAGFSPMPKGGVKMTDCNISKIKAWIEAGSINN